MNIFCGDSFSLFMSEHTPRQYYHIQIKWFYAYYIHRDERVCERGRQQEWKWEKEREGQGEREGEKERKERELLGVRRDTLWSKE